MIYRRCDCCYTELDDKTGYQTYTLDTKLIIPDGNPGVTALELCSICTDKLIAFIAQYELSKILRKKK